MDVKSIDSAVITSTASTISNLNEELNQTLLASQASVQALSGFWTGQAAETTIAAFNTFAANYFAKYKEMLNNYVTFLNKSANEEYDATERANVSKADQI